ncbi:U6 snRNA-associated Sm-like protein LSm7 [Polychytrium aggregatum]|uniref:U6 snRNA-associated Sm-like protein LSm7 n=1 Tax=Polychytrium aggregatum TaxID=110093 RepID=UPI0022FEC3B1|nr:U6 snRNA-associated Sm-like protein LSm7 [Polychytrium aggregatum]KAI9206898.1 U6 snRNA-associated Sm-like protein LSm7 [Polychytrium aggregatum]
MSDRGRGGRNAGGNRGKGRGGSSRGGGNAGGSGSQGERKKESILDLTKYLDKKIRVKYAGGREVVGVLKGFDPLLNLVLDDTEEFLRDPEDSNKLLDDTRTLGLVVCRGPTVILISPFDGYEEIENPFLAAQRMAMASAQE